MLNIVDWELKHEIYINIVYWFTYHSKKEDLLTGVDIWLFFGLVLSSKRLLDALKSFAFAKLQNRHHHEPQGGWWSEACLYNTSRSYQTLLPKLQNNDQHLLAWTRTWNVNFELIWLKVDPCLIYMTYAFSLVARYLLF